ncbi:MAG: HNH endonuclease [Candidatus Omnitrophica bacterium]|nr:HNH endonuclease [Candidatus Omnitrophota bacterium]
MKWIITVLLLCAPWEGGGRKVSCKICNKNFYAKQCSEKYNRGKFCSRKCYAEWLSQNNRGEAHPNWQGGKSFEPYGLKFNKQLKERIRIRDNFICQECGKTQNELKRKLAIHHIDYCKQNNNPDNLVSLCVSCHPKTNFGRKEWENYYKNKIRGVKK